MKRVNQKRVKKPAPAQAPDAFPPMDNSAWIDGKCRYGLTRPIQAAGEMIEFITLREPTTGDVIEAGNPCEFDPATTPPKVKFDERKQAAMISRLANIPPSSVQRMHPKDFAAIGWIIADFFLPV